MAYDAFISYAHESEPLGRALENALEHLTRPFYARTPLMRVCRDKTSFTGGELSDAMYRALDESKHLVVLLSPEAAASEYVDIELKYFLGQRELLDKKHSKPVSFVIDRWSRDQHDKPLRSDFTWATADVTPTMKENFTEPLVVDMREHVRNRTLRLKDKDFEDKVAMVAGAILGRDKDELVGNAIVMRAKNRAAVIAAVILVAAILFAVPGWLFARSAQRTAESRRATAEQEVVLAQQELEDLDRQLATANDDLSLAQTGLMDAENELADKEDELAVAEERLTTVESDLEATEAQRSAAVVERNLARAARDDAVRLRDAAAAARDAAQAERDAAEIQRAVAAAARDEAEAARDEAEGDRDAAVVARDAANLARDAAVVARDAATLEAERQLTIADARRLSGLALANLDDDLPLASLLAIESVNRSIAGVSSGDAAALVRTPAAPQPVYESRAALMRTLQARPRLVAQLQTESGSIGDIATSADGNLFAGAGEGRIQLWEPRTLETSRAIDVASIVTGQSIAIRPGADLIAIGGTDQNTNNARVVLVDAATGRQVETLTPPIDSAVELEELAFSSDGRWLALTTTSLVAGRIDIRIWDTRNGFRSVDIDADGHTTLSFSADGRWLATAGDGVQIWNVGSWDRHVVPQGADQSAFRSVRFSGGLLFAAPLDGTLGSWDATTFEVAGEAACCKPDTTFGPLATKDGLLAVVADRSDIELRDTTSLDHLATIATGKGIDRVAFTGDGRLAALADGVVTVWHESNEHPLGEFVEGRVLALFDDTVAVRDDGNVARLLDRSTGTTVGIETPRDDDVVQSLQFSRDRSVAVGLSDSRSDGTRLVVWNRNGTVRHTIVPRAGSPTMVALAPDGSRVAVAGSAFIEFWAPGTGTFDGQLPIGAESFVRHVAFGSGTTLFVAGEDSISTWDLSSSTRTQVVVPDPYREPGFAVHPNGDSVSIASERRITRRSLPNLDLEGEFLVPDNNATWREVAISADGALLAAGADTGEISWWDVATGLPLGEPIRPHEQIGIEAPVVLFGSTGATLATYPAAHSGPARLWELDVPSLIERACSRANRNLTQDEWARYLPRADYRVTCPALPPGG